MLIKILVMIVFFVILIALGSGLFFLLRDGSGSDRTVKALTWRIALSISLFAVLFVFYALGWLHPHAVF